MDKDRLYQVLRDDLLDGKYPSDSPMPSGRQLAAIYGANKDCTNGVLAALEAEGLIRRQGYRRHPVRRHRSEERVIAIEYVPHSGAHPFYAAFNEGFLIRLLSLQYGVQHFTHYGGSQGTSVCKAPVISSALERNILKGIVFPELNRPSLEDLQTFRDYRVAVTALERERRPGAIVLDIEQAALRATHYLLSRGYSSVGIVTSRKFRYGSGIDIRGYQQALELMENAAPEDVIDCVHGVDDDFTESLLESESFDITLSLRYRRVIKSGFDAVTHRIQQRSLPEALYIADEFLAIGVLRAIHQAGLRIPDDVAVVSHASANNWSFELSGLTVMRFDGHACGVQAGQFIVDIAEGRRQPDDQLVLQATFVKGASCGERESNHSPEIVHWGLE